MTSARACRGSIQRSDHVMTGTCEWGMCSCSETALKWSKTRMKVFQCCQILPTAVQYGQDYSICFHGPQSSPSLQAQDHGVFCTQLSLWTSQTIPWPLEPIEHSTVLELFGSKGNEYSGVSRLVPSKVLEKPPTIVTQALICAIRPPTLLAMQPEPQVYS